MLQSMGLQDFPLTERFVDVVCACNWVIFLLSTLDVALTGKAGNILGLYAVLEAKLF
jgi:hypothetical protein